MKVLVCGGRDYKDAATVDHELTMLWPDEIIEGGANGADKLAREWAQRNNCPCRTFPADWQQHGKAAGPIRNRQMLNEGRPDLVLAFPGGRGTEDMVHCAKVNGITVRDMRYTTPSSSAFPASTTPGGTTPSPDPSPDGQAVALSHPR